MIFLGRTGQIGSPAVFRTNRDAVQRAIFITDPSDAVPFDGVIIEWHVFFRKDLQNVDVYLQIWRPVKHNNKRLFKLIGKTRVASLWPGHAQFVLWPEDRIDVNEEDVMAISFSRYA